MKLLIFLAIFGLSYATPSERDLASDFQQIVALIPLEEIREVAKRYHAVDPEFQQVVAYLQSREWAALVASIRDKESWQHFKNYMFQNGVDIDAILDGIYDIFEAARVTPNANVQRSLKEFLIEIGALIDLEAILIKTNELMNTSESFQEFYVFISSPESRAFIEEVRAMPEVQHIEHVLRHMQIDVDAIIALVYTIFGWQ